MNKTAEVLVETPVGNTSPIQIEEVVKQGTIFGSVICCASTSRVNSIHKTVKYEYGKISIGMPVYMDDISAVGNAENVRKGIQNCRRMEIEKKMEYGLKKSKYMIIGTGKDKEEEIKEVVKEGMIQRTETYKYLGLIINEKGNLKDHIKELQKKCESANREIRAIGSKQQVGKEEVRVKMKLFETCITTILTYGIDAWGKISNEELNEIEKIQAKSMKQIFDQPVSTSYIGLIMETRIWPTKQRLKYCSMMLYHNLVNSDDKRKVKQILEEQKTEHYSNTFYERVEAIAKELDIQLAKAGTTSKSKWKKETKEALMSQIEKRTRDEMEGKTKARTVKLEKWGLKRYMKECDSDTIKDIIKIRLHMWEVKCNFKKNNTEEICPICSQTEDTTEHVLK